MVREDRDQIVAGARGRAVERVRGRAADRAVRLGVPSDPLPPRAPLAHLLTHQLVALTREQHRLADGVVQRQGQRDRHDDRHARTGRDLAARRQRDGHRSPELAVVDPDQLTLLTEGRALGRGRERAARGQLRVRRARESHRSLPVRADPGIAVRGPRGV